MNNYLYLPAVFLLLVLSVSAQAVELWRGAESGQSKDQVLSKFSNAKSNPNPTALSGGASCEVLIKSLEVTSYPFEVCFYFLEDKLKQVTLTLVSGDRGSEGDSIFDRVLEALQSKYGQENNLKRDAGSIATFNSANWYLGSLNINLTMIYVGEDDEVILNVNYQTRVSEGAENL